MMELPLSTEARNALDRVERVALDAIAPAAALCDRDNQFPHAAFEALRREGLLAMAVPKDHGGMGLGLDADPLAWTLALELMARADCSTSQTFQITGHCLTYFSEMGTEAQKRKYFSEVLKAGRLFCSAGSEPSFHTTARVGRRMPISTVARRVAGGYELIGRKHFNSLAGVADWYVIFANLEGVDNPLKSLTLFVVAKDNPGLHVEMNWDAMGMRATATNGLLLDHCLVRDEDVLGGPGGYIGSVINHAYFIAFAANYLGGAQAAYDWAAKYVADKVEGGEDPLMQYHFGQVDVAIESARLVLYDAALLWRRWLEHGRRDHDLKPAHVASHRAKILCAQAALMATDTALEICGGRATLKTSPIERIHRDVRTYTVAPPVIDRSLELLGRNKLANPERAETEWTLH
jgi:alkylation response protein AidB-like acyl-CoA dehydrogenase